LYINQSIKLSLEHISVLGGGLGLVVHKRNKSLEVGVRLDVLKVPKGPRLALGLLVLASLALLVLDAGLVLAGKLVVSRPDTLGNSLPELPALPLALLLNGLNDNLLLGGLGVVEDGALARANSRSVGPLALVGLNLLAVLGESRLERVGLAREVTATFVLDVSTVTCAALDGRGLGKLNVRSTPDDTLNTELG
jgi:hypothetical protein